MELDGKYGLRGFGHDKFWGFRDVRNTAGWQKSVPSLARSREAKSQQSYATTTKVASL